MARTIIFSAFFILVILTSSYYILMPDKIRINVQDTKTIYSVWENGEWVKAATEYVQLWDGVRKMRAKSRTVYYENEGNLIIFHRDVIWKDNIVTNETIIFDYLVDDVERVPIEHYITGTNWEGKILAFEYRDILYTGLTQDITSPFSFGHKMTLEWQDGAYYAKVKQQKVASDKIIIKYRPINDAVYQVRLFDPPTCTVNLSLNGYQANTSYELGTIVQFVATSFWTNGSIAPFDVGLLINDTRFSLLTGTSPYRYNLTLDSLIERKFDNNYENLTRNLTSDIDTFFLLPNRSFPDGGNFTLFGYNRSDTYDAGFPYDIAIYIGNLTEPSEFLPGYLNGTVLHQKNLSTGESTKNITFTSAGSTTIYINLSRVGGDAGNSTIQISGSGLDQNNQFTQHDFFNDTSNITFGDSYEFTDLNASFFWMWDDGITNYSGKYDQQYSGTARFYGASKDSYRRTTTTSSSTCTGGGGTGCESGNDIDWAYEETVNFDAEETARVEFKVFCNAYETNIVEGCGGGEDTTRSENANCNFYLSGTSTETIETLTTGGSQTARYHLEKIDDSTGTWAAYKDGTFLKQIVMDEEDIELRFRAYSQTAVTVPDNCNPDTSPIAGASGDMRLYYVNLTGIGLNWNGSGHNASTSVQSKSIFQSTASISRAYLEVEEYKPRQTIISYELSNDNGTTWFVALPDAFTSFTTTGKNLTYRVNMSTNFTNNTPRVRNLKLSIIPARINNLSFDFNNDGSIEWNFTGELNGTNSPQNITLNFTESGMGTFISLLNRKTGLFPIKITTESQGVLEINQLDFRTNITTINFNKTFLDKAYQDYLVLLSKTDRRAINISMTYSNGMLQLDNLRAQYKGKNNLTIYANSTNSSCVPVKHEIMYHYSKLNETYPTGVEFYDVFPSSLNDKEIEPFGQSSSTNRNISFFNLTMAYAYTYSVNIYEYFAPAIDDCLNLSSCNSSDRTNCIQPNATDFQLIVPNITGKKEIYHWWNLTNCSPTNLYLPANISHSPYCESCILTR